MRRNKTGSPRFHRALHATAMFSATVAVLLLVSRAAGSPAPLERASYRPVDQGLDTPESYNRTRRQVRGRAFWGETTVIRCALQYGPHMGGGDRTPAAPWRGVAWRAFCLQVPRLLTAVACANCFFLFGLFM